MKLFSRCVFLLVAGHWGQCVGEDCGSSGVQTRTIWCVHEEGWTTHHSHCQHADKPGSQRPCFKVCNWHQNLFEWDVSEWSDCVLVPFYSNELKLRTSECVTAQHGVQRRRVLCVRTANRTTVTSRICEFFSQKPPVEQACLIPCPQDCVLSDFTSWSSCSKTCGAGLQHRTRHVLTTQMYGGMHCPNLTETRTCSNPVDCPTGEDKHQYSLKVGAWSECRMPHHKDVLLSGRTTVDFSISANESNTVISHTHHQNQHHRHLQHHNNSHYYYPMSWELEVGYQTRQVRCTRSDGSTQTLVSLICSLCTKEAPPLTFQSCVMSRNCQTSDWSSWSPCSKTCRSIDLSPGYRIRSRIMTQIPVRGGKQCPALEEKQACNIMGDLLLKCPRYAWRTTDWGDCRVLPLLSQQDKRLINISILCGGGIQTRKTYCVQVPDDLELLGSPFLFFSVCLGSRPVSSRLCDAEDQPLVVQLCSVPCQQHCLVSPWSPWGACEHDNCDEPEGKKGFKQRRRELLWESNSTLGTSPHLTEFIPCENPTCYLWQVQRHGGCVPTKSSCGPGTVVSNVTCVSITGESVSNAHCDGDPPPTEEACEVACSADCVVGSWSSWSSCSHSCASKTSEGRQSRSRSVLAIPGKEGKVCPAGPALEEWRTCNEHPCTVFYWEASAWGPCIDEDSLDGNESSSWNGTWGCSAGVQTRKVNCVKMAAGPVPSKRCSDSSRPESVRPCSPPCQKDCIVTPFSEWTACPTTCLPENSTTATQSRYRTIIQKSANGGQECPDTLHEERECESHRVCPEYRWRLHKWHSCTLVPDSVRRGSSGPTETCGNGLETRGVSCVGESGEPANVTDCLQWAGPLPSQIQQCRVPCRDDCTLAAWSRFSECSGCGSFMSRRRSLTGRSKKKDHCLNEKLHPLEETLACPCDTFLSQPYGNWSACILPHPTVIGSLHGWMSHREVKECGQGLRYRAVACINQQGHLVDPTLCTESGYMVEVCHIPCPLDCKLSDWSSWSGCSATCGGGLKTRSKWLREKAFNGGRPCPKLDLKNQVYEALPCYSECNNYEWKMEPWSICTINTVDDLPACGEGVQSRKIRSVTWLDGAVEDSLCDQDEMPARAQVCYLACPDDCVTTPWGAWSNCPAVRTIHKSPWDYFFSRAIIISYYMKKTIATSKQNCSDWSTCTLSENAICGQGFRLRLLDCVRSDGKIVPQERCEEHGLINKWRLSESCAVQCPVSCILSDWSPWADCSDTCGSRGKHNEQNVVDEAHDEGFPCSNQLTQTKPCPIRPCYMWLLSDWSPCAIEGAECGEGYRRRNLTCVVHWGDVHETPPQQVTEELCGDALMQHIQQDMEQPCFLPCPGDCHLTEWSSWSSCQLTCLEGRSFETTGRRARSRAVIIQVMENQGSCPQQVFETQPCKGGKCHSYQWRSGGWSNNERVVWCQRSDGVNVTGGCFQQSRPTTLRRCHPPCTKPFSHCTPSGVCGCEKGYTEVMTTHGFLDYCTRTPGVDSNKKANVKTNSGRVKPGPSPTRDLFNEWSFRPVGPGTERKITFIAQTGIVRNALGFEPAFVELGLLSEREKFIQSRCFKRVYYYILP
uniref:Thrombospondin, type I, domain containing 7Ba n=1 Tax=Gouania willdenowi TaxID=441366 RepID=A0A8C5G0V7_GOUWI